MKETFLAMLEKYYSKIIFEQSEKIYLNDNFAFCILHFEFTNYRFRPRG